MNNKFLGNAACLIKYDLVIKLANILNLPVWYITMLTEAEERNKGDKNATNYRIGSQNESLLDLMKTSFYGEESSVNDIYDHIREQNVKLKAIAIRNNQKAENFKIGYITFFTHKDRDAYFQGLVALLDKTIGQILFLDPDTGVMPSVKKLKSAKGSSAVTSLELKYIMDNISDESVVMVFQQLNDYSYSHEARVKDLQSDLHPTIILLVDEVIQSGIYFFTKSQEVHDALSNFLWELLNEYRFLKSTERVLIVTGNKEGISSKALGLKVKSTKDIAAKVEANISEETA